MAATASLFPAVLAGCQTGPGGSSGLAAEAPTARFEMDPIADANLPAKVLYSVRASGDEDSKAALFDRILDGGATARGTRPPLPADQYIAFDGAVVELSEEVVDDASETSVKTYRYTADRVATMPAYGRQMRDRFGFALSDLSTEQRDVVETAIEDGGYVVESDESPPRALLELAEQFRAQDQARGLDEPGEGDLSGPYLVRFDEEVYWTVFVVDREAFGRRTDRPPARADYYS